MQLIKYFHELSLHPNNAKELKGLILQLAIEGKLTVQWRKDNPEIESAENLLQNMREEKAQLIKDKKAKKEQALPSLNKKEVPFVLPKGWVWGRFYETCEKITQGPNPEYKTPTDSRFRVLKTKDFYNHIIHYDRCDDISNDDFYEWERFELLTNDIIFGLVGKGSTGKCNIFKEQIGIRYIFTRATGLFRLLPKNTISPDIVKIYFSSIFGKRQIDSITDGSTGQLVIKTSEIKRLLFPIPPLKEQEAIVETVNQLFKEVEQLEQLTVERIQLKEQFATSALNQLATNNTIKEWAFLQEHFHPFFNHQPNIKKLRETVLQLAVQGKLTSDFRLCHPELREGSHSAAALLEQIKTEKARLVKEKIIKKENPLPAINKDAIPFEIPENWVWCSLGDIGSTNIGLTYSPNDISDKGIPVLRSSNVQNGEITLQDLVRVNKDVNENAKVQNGDILICARNGSKRLVGKCAIISDLSEETAFGAFMAIFRSNCNPYIKYFIESPVYRRSLEGVSTTTINQITQSNLKETLIPLPPLSEQKAIVETVNRLMTLCDQLEKVVQQSEKQVELVMKGVLREVLG